MNHENPQLHPDEPGGYQPRHGEDQALDPATMTPSELIARIADHAPHPDAAQQIRDAFARHGGAWAVYLSLADTDRYGQDTETGFRNTYLHTYRDREALIADTIDDFDWQRDLDSRLASDPLLRAVVTFDRQAIWGFVSDHYTIIETEDGVHVFEQDA